MIASHGVLDTKAVLQSASIRPTRQRQVLVRLLFAGKNRHVTAESLHAEACAQGTKMALATVYNSLRRFTNAGLLRELVVDARRRYFDTNITHHHHILSEQTGELVDIDPENIEVVGLPTLPRGTSVSQIDIVVRIK